MKKLIYFFIVTILVLSTNVYSQWTFVGGITGVPSGESPSISVVSPTCAWIATGSTTTAPLVSRTTNGGVTWTATGTTGLAALDLFCCWAVDSLTCYVGNGGGAGGAGGNATFYKTTNGGTSWTAVLSTGGTGGFFNGIVFSKINPQFGVAQSDPPTGLGGAYYFSTTSNGGTSWTTLATPPAGLSGCASAQNSIFVVDQNFYGFGVSSGTTAAPIRFYLTTNGGTSWLLRTTALVNGTFTNGIAFSDDKNTGVVISSTSLPTIARTTNAGATFTNISTGVSATAGTQMKWLRNSNTVYSAATTGASGCIIKSTNGGLNWVTQTTNSLNNLSSLDFYQFGNVVYGYAVGLDGSVVKIVETITGVENPSTNLPSQYSLEQNYPNPFNPTTNINFSLPKASDVSLKVYDALGNEVMSLVNEFKNAGTHSVIVNASNLTSGIYFYKLQAGEFVSTKKLTLIK